MKNALRSFCSLTVVLTIVGGATPLLAQQTPERDRVMIERERSQGGADPATIVGGARATFERQVMAQGPPVSGDFVFLATEMSMGGKLVKGAPYSAQAVQESTQVLSDGNRIVNKSVAMIYRDSEGRTRREQTIKAIGPMGRGGEPTQTIFINDVVSGASYTLDPKTQVARKMPPVRFKVQGPAQGSGGVQGQSIGSATGSGTTVLEFDRHDNLIGVQSGTAKRQYESAVSFGWLDARNPSAKTEQLGKQNINGVESEGVRTTVTIAPGEIGNERAIEIVSERWFSPELQQIVMTRHMDPRFGENTYQLVDINRTEPARELFEVPPGYRVEESPVYGVAAGKSSATNISGGGLNGKAISLPMPEYPMIARQAQASGSVTVQVTVDEEGNVASATAVSGHPLLRSAAVTAAQKAKFTPTKLNGQPVKVTGVLTYFFTVQ